MKKKIIHTSYIKSISDIWTPVSIYQKLRDIFPNSLLLESADYHSKSNSKSFICLDPLAGFEAKRDTYKIEFSGSETFNAQVDDPNEVFHAFMDFHSLFRTGNNDIARNTAGLFGFSSFESVRYMEEIDIDKKNSPSKNNPDLKYQLFRFVLVFDHYKNELILTKNHLEGSPESKFSLEKILELLKNINSPGFDFQRIAEEGSVISDQEYLEYVRKGIDHCQRGDVFQVVLSREFSQKFKGDDFKVYRCLRSINPSPYLFYFDYGDFKIFGSSPESQIQVMDSHAHINPIAGTIKRGLNANDDQARAEKLKNDPKEKAEHVMLVDLARNDLSRNSNKIFVDSYGEIQYFSHVNHMVSKVSASLDESVSGLDIFSDTFPAGTLSGAPKYKALQIINANEKVARNFYGGAIGFFGFDNSVNHAIIIRSILSKNNTLIYQAGAGIVVNSIARNELKEVNNKVAALRKAIKMAEDI